MKCWTVSICGALLALIPSLSCAEVGPTLRVPPARFADDTSYIYFTELLTKALQKGANGRVVPRLMLTMPMSTDRKLHELRLRRTLDVFWLGASAARARDLRVVPIPLDRGLIGYRQFIIRKDREADFDKVSKVSDLAKLRACQETHWVDSDIFRDAQLPLVTSLNFEGFYKQLVAGRCDYFPRGYHEAAIEMEKRAKRYPDLMVYKALILHYPFTSYFYVNRDNKVLAQWLQDGLEKMIEDGELLRFMQQHEHTRNAFPLDSSKPQRMLVIPNHYLPDKTNAGDVRYWFQPSEFGAVAD